MRPNFDIKLRPYSPLNSATLRYSIEVTLVPQYNMCCITYPKWRVGITIEWTWMPLGLIGISWHWFFPEVVIMRIIPMGTRSGMHRGAGMHRTFPKVSDQITWGYDTMRYSGTTQDRRGCAWFTREIAGIICKKKRRKYVLRYVRNIFFCKYVFYFLCLTIKVY